MSGVSEDDAMSKCEEKPARDTHLLASQKSGAERSSTRRPQKPVKFVPRNGAFEKVVQMRQHKSIQGDLT